MKTSIASLSLWDPPPNPFEIVLDTEDGLNRRTVFVCDLLYSANTSDITQKRGEVTHDRKGDICRKILRGLSLAGL